ncbi:MAG: 50S ribosomal protein L10 [Bacillota bacterium]
MSAETIRVKEEKVNEVIEMFKDAKSVVLVDYRGLTVEEADNLRNEFRKEGVVYHVIKNSLVERAVAQLNIEGMNPYLKGPSAFAFGYNDPVTPAKIVSDFIKKTKKMSIKAGLVDNKVIDENGVKALAALPSREVLLAKLLGSLNAPAAGLVTVLGGTIRSLLYTLNAIQEKKA